MTLTAAKSKILKSFFHNDTKRCHENMSRRRMDSAPSLVDFIEIYDGPKLHTGAANLSHLDRQQHQPIHYQQEVAPRPESGAAMIDALPTSWLVFDKQRHRPKHPTADNKKNDSPFWIDPASVAYYPNQDLGGQFWKEPQLIYPDATPQEWQPRHAIESNSINAPLSAQSNKRCMVENDTVQRTSQKHQKRSCTDAADAAAAAAGIGIHLNASPKLSDKWQHKFDLLCEFHHENGHCRVPQRFVADSVKLGHWVRTQRTLYKR
jgi:Helicase associated domain